MLLYLLTNTTIAKFMYFSGFTFSTIGMAKEAKVTNSGFLETLLENIPAQILYVLGIVYGISLVFGKLSDAWTKYRLNNIKVEQEQELLEQRELETERSRKKL